MIIHTYVVLQPSIIDSVSVHVTELLFAESKP